MVSLADILAFIIPTLAILIWLGVVLFIDRKRKP